MLEAWKHIMAGKGNQFVLTEKGYATTPEDVKHERKIGSPVKGFETRVPGSWVMNGWVKEVAVNG